MILFEGVRVIELFPQRVSEPLDLAVEGGRIAALGPGLAAHYPTARREASPPYVSAGLVCSHNHLYSALARGLLVDIESSKDFVGQLEHLWWRLDRSLDEQIILSSIRAGAAEAAMCGTTSIVDHHASPECIDGSLSIVKSGFESVGIRGVLCYETSDRNGHAGARSGVRENLRFAAEIDEARAAPGAADDAVPLIEAAIGAHAGFTLEDETIEALGEAVRSSGRGIHIHAAEDRFDATDSRYRRGTDLAARLDASGCLGPKSIIAHGLYLTEGELDLLNERDVFLAHNARSNMNNGVGYASLLPKARNVVIGTDGIGSDMVQETAFAYFKHRDVHGLLAPGAFLEMLDRGNRILERYFADFGLGFGRVEPGSAADLVFWDYDAPTPLEGRNLDGHFLFGLSSRSVRSVMVAGRYVVKDREPQFDSGEIFARSREETRRLWKRMEERR